MQKAFIRIATILVCTIVASAGLAFLLTPARSSPPSPWVWVADVDKLPEDGTPIRVSVVIRERDAWTWLPDRLMGHVFLRRVVGADTVIALKEITRYGTRVRYDDDIGMFDDPCRIAWRFDLDGKCLADPGWSDLLKLDVQIREGRVYISLRDLR